MEDNTFPKRGNVGIGTAEPAARLTIEDTTHINVILARTDSEDHMTLTVGDSGTGIHFSDSNRFFISADPYASRNTTVFGNEILTILPSGNIGIGTTQVGKELEVVGNIVSRESPEALKTAVALAAEPNGLASLWTNVSYDPSRPTSGFKRTINMRNGNVGIGRNTQDPQEKLVVDGNILATGDVQLSGADCAEEFRIEESSQTEPGTVMVIGDEETLHHCTEAYDHRVAGILSGAGDLKPGIVLGKQQSEPTRQPLALTGKVFCKVDAGYASISVGDLLTTSPTAGHAMKAADPSKAFGAVIGKALRPLSSGTGLVPILVSLQ